MAVLPYPVPVSIPPGSPQGPPVSRARLAVLSLFFAAGSFYGTWASRIPEVQLRLGLSESELGGVLLALAVGTIAALLVSGWLVERLGSRAVIAASLTVAAGGLLLLSITPSALLLFLVLLGFGAAMSALDVAMNAQAVWVEQRAGTARMSSFHAAFSLGALVGSASGAGLIALGLPIFAHFAIVGTAMLVQGTLQLGALLADRTTANSRAPESPDHAMEIGTVQPDATVAPGGSNAEVGPAFQIPPRVTWGLGFIAMISTVGEAVMGDWTGIYLRDVVAAEPGVYALGFAAFSAMMTIGRFAGDSLGRRVRSERLVRAAGGLAAGGIGLAVMVPTVLTSLIGFAAVGAGLSIVIPIAFSAAGRLPGVSAGRALASVATIGYAGFLIAPPLVGTMADRFGLRVSMLVVAALLALLVPAAGALKGQDTVR